MSGANSTAPEAHSVHGTNPQHLVERITRDKIYAMTYWKEKCFGVSAAALVDLAMDIREFGGVFGGTQRCTNFICLLLKMLQIQPNKEIIVEFIKNEEHKYVRLLGAFYLRLVGKPLEVYQYLEPLYNDYRRVRRRTADGRFALEHVDQFIDELLTHDMVCDIALPRIPHRWTLEATGALAPRRSVLEEDVEMAMEEGEDPDAALAAAAARAELEVAREAARGGAGSLPPPPPLREAPRDARERSPRRRSRSRSRERKRRSRSRSRERKKRRSRSRSRDRKRRSRSRDRGAKAPPAPEAPLDPIAAENALRASLGLKPLR